MGLGRWTPVAALLALCAPAAADVGDFYGIWTDSQTDGSGIARIVILPGDGNRAAIHLYGRCVPGECDWGIQPARAYAGGPGGGEIQSLAAEFDNAGVRRRLVLRPAVGHALRFEIETDYADGSGQANYAVTGALDYAGDWSAAPRVAEAPAGAPTPQPVAPEARSSASSFFGLGPAAASGYVPAAGEDCRPFNPDQVRVGVVDGDWRVGDFATRLLNFGPYQSAARRAKLVLDNYHFDEQCFVGHGSDAMMYWKRAGHVPNTALRDADCVALGPSGVKLVQKEDGWQVVSGAAVLLAFDDKADAERALSVIATYKLDRQCFFDRGAGRAQYWLAH